MATIAQLWLGVAMWTRKPQSDRTYIDGFAVEPPAAIGVSDGIARTKRGRR